MKNWFSAFLILTLLLPFTGHASDVTAGIPVKSNCEKRLLNLDAEMEELGRCFGRFCREVRDTQGMRLYFQPKVEDDAIRWMGLMSKNSELNTGVFNRTLNYFQTPSRWIGRLLGQEGYHFTPGGFLNHTFIDKPIELVSEYLTGRRFRAAIMTSLIAGLAIGTPIYSYVDGRLTQAELRESANTEFLIDYDYRFREIKNLRDQMKITDEQAELQAEGMKLVIADYWKRLGTMDEEALINYDISQVMANPGNPLFVHLKDMFENGISDFPNFTHGSRGLGALTDLEKRDLVLLTQETYLRMALAADLVSGKENSTALHAPAWLKERVGQFQQDDFFKTVMLSPKSRAEKLRLIDTDLWDQLSLAINKRLEITFVTGSDKKEVTLTMIRDQRLRKWLAPAQP